MRHRVATLKFKYGKDANSMLLRKLLRNFVQSGSMVTTAQKARYMRSSIDRMITHAKKETEASKNMLLRLFGDSAFIKTLQKEVAPALKGRTSGYTTTMRMGQRDSDGAMMVKISWITPVEIKGKEQLDKSKGELKVQSSTPRAEGGKGVVKAGKTVKVAKTKKK